MVDRIGKDSPAASYWSDNAEAYAAAISNAYHRHRIEVARDLYRAFDPAGKTVLDFGCGDGVMLDDFPGAAVIGVEPNEQLLAIARKKCPSGSFYRGGVAEISRIGKNSLDLILCINVAAYFTNEEDLQFYKEVGRALKPGGALVITHSNELFDLFTFNSYTVEFFKVHFGCDVGSLLVNPEKPDAHTYNIRENPLSYRFKLASFGLREERQIFINLHTRPPLFGKEKDRFPDTLAFPLDQQWKLPFQCSTFGSLAVKL